MRFDLKLPDHMSGLKVQPSTRRGISGLCPMYQVRKGRLIERASSLRINRPAHGDLLKQSFYRLLRELAAVPCSRHAKKNATLPMVSFHAHYRTQQMWRHLLTLEPKVRRQFGRKRNISHGHSALQRKGHGDCRCSHLRRCR
jgi:hypothetical protein